MKKLIAMFIAVLSLLLLSVPVTAAQGQNGNIGTTVPTEHSVSIEAEHAFALYTEGSKGQSAAYLVPRFSEPQFTLQAEDGYRITRVLVNDRDVTAQVTDGVLKLSSVKADVTITIVTEADTKEPERPGDTEAPENPKDTEQPENPKDTEQPGKPGNSRPDSSDSANHTPKPDSAADNTSSSAENSSVENSADTSDLSSVLPGVLLAAAGVCLLFAGAGALKKRMKDE